MLYVWPKIKRLLHMYRHYPDLNMISKQYHEQDNTNTYQLFEPALQQIIQPYSRKTLYNYEEKYQFYSAYKCSVVVAWKRAFPIYYHFPLDTIGSLVT